MALFSKRTTQTTNATSYAQNLGASDVRGDAYVIGGNNNTILDGGAIAESFNYAKQNTERAFDFIEGADAANTDRLNTFLSASENINKSVLENADKTTASVTNAFKQAANPSRDYIIMALVAASIIAVVYKVG